ncbi:MAG: phosphate/phosphite/phosphonate ABC transporter substrate-binding protein, partial [Acidimicrobiia bacterium]
MAVVDMRLISATSLSPVQNAFFHAIWAWLAKAVDVDLTIKEIQKEPDVVHRCSLPTGQNLERYEPIVAPVLARERYGDMPVYFSDLVVAPGVTGPPTRGWRIAYNEQDSLSGWFAPRWGLRALGLDPSSMTWIRTGSHLNSLMAIRRGEAEAGGIDSTVLDLTAGESAPGAGLEIVENFGPWPAPP